MRRLASPHRFLALASLVALALGSAVTATALGAAGQTYVSARYHYSLPGPGRTQAGPCEGRSDRRILPGRAEPGGRLLRHQNNSTGIAVASVAPGRDGPQEVGARRIFRRSLSISAATAPSTRRSAWTALLRSSSSTPRPATATSTRSRSSTAAAGTTSTGSARPTDAGPGPVPRRHQGISLHFVEGPRDPRPGSGTIVAGQGARRPPTLQTTE